MWYEAYSDYGVTREIERRNNVALCAIHTIYSDSLP